jgi:Vam6/Vps39-like protein vacuolar protein sorting-associated protein 39
MSLEATWDLKSASSPRSLCVYTAAASSQETNPFEVASGESHAAQAVVYGTERGSLHYRTYAPPSRGNNRSDLSSLTPTSSGASSSNHNQGGRIQAPLGVTPSGRPPANLPRAYFPVDLAGALPGVVAAVIHATTAPSHRPVFLLLVDDNRGTSATAPGAYVATLVTLQHGSFTKIPTSSPLPRVSCATFHPNCGYVCAAGRTIHTIGPDVFEGDNDSRRRSKSTALKNRAIDFSSTLLPTPGARGGQDAIEVTSNGKVVAIGVGNSVYAFSGSDTSALSSVETDDARAGSASAPSNLHGGDCVKVASFAQSSQVHPVIVIDLKDKSMDPEWSCLFLANGRECGIVDVQYGPASHPILSCGKPRNGMVTMASPILAAATSWPWLAVLTSDGLISIRSPSCMAIPLKTVEVGTRPNDFFVLRALRDDSQPVPWIMAISYSGEGKVLQCQPDTAQDLADRLMRLSIDAFGANGFPRSELAEAVHASFTATSYVGPDPTAHARELLRQYLEAVLGLADFDGGCTSGWPTEMTAHDSASSINLRAGHHGVFDEVGAFSGRGDAQPTQVSSNTPPALVTGTALLCLVCSQLSPPKASLSNRAAKACATKVGVVVDAGTSSSELSSTAVSVCEMVADRLLREANKNFSLLSSSSSTSAPIASTNRTNSHANVHMDFVEAATWLLRSAGRHERAIGVLYERLQQQRPPAAAQNADDPEASSTSSFRASGFWSQIKYESYTATHLSELWATGKGEACKLVLTSQATYRLLEHNPRLGLGVFTSMHPKNNNQWKSMPARDDPLMHPTYPSQVIKLLKSINPAVPYDGREALQSMEEAGSGLNPRDAHAVLPLESGRALAVTFLESAIGISSGRPTEEDEFDFLAPDKDFEERVANFHDELCFLLLEGVISERGDDDHDTDTELGGIYRIKLRHLLRWPLAKVRSERLLTSLPSSFLQEQALVLGRLGRHEDALRILYCKLQSMDLALEYCDLRHERQEAKKEQERARLIAAGLLDDRYDLDNPHPHGQKGRDCAYLPLVRVALESDPDTKQGTTAAIQVLALRRGAIDRAAALRLLPKNVPVSAVARPFLIPALVDSESQVRRLTVVSALLRARYVALKQKLTDTQLKAQASLHVVPQLRPLNLGNPLHSTKPIRARPSSSASTTFPDVVIVKHFFPRHVVIQAQVTNNSPSVDGRALGSVAFVVAESSEESIQPSMQVPIKVLPFMAAGSTWFVLSAVPQRMEGTAILTCELRYTVLAVDATTGAPLSFGIGISGTSGRTFVEELQDLEVFSSHFS